MEYRRETSQIWMIVSPNSLRYTSMHFGERSTNVMGRARIPLAPRSCQAERKALQDAIRKVAGTGMLSFDPDFCRKYTFIDFMCIENAGLHRSSHFFQDRMSNNHWLVVWLPSILFSQKYWECHHPNWRNHILQRGYSPTTNQLSMLKVTSGVQFPDTAIQGPDLKWSEQFAA